MLTFFKNVIYTYAPTLNTLITYKSLRNKFLKKAILSSLSYNTKAEIQRDCLANFHKTVINKPGVTSSPPPQNHFCFVFTLYTTGDVY